MLPSGISEQYVDVPSSGEASGRGLEVVRAAISRQTGDGWALNEWPNRHLSGCLTHLRRRRNATGARRVREFISLDSELAQLNSVQWVIETETDRINGPPSPPGAPSGGELEGVVEARAGLANWLTLSQAEKADINLVFQAIANVRRRAVNPLNVAAGQRAASMVGTRDQLGRPNPSVTMAKSLPLERQLNQRLDELATNRRVNDARRQRFTYQWLREEQYGLAYCDAALGAWQQSESDEDFYRLLLAARTVRFRVQPFNYLAWQRKQALGTPAEMAATAREGLQFSRLKAHLLMPFRQLAGVRPAANSRQQAQERLDILGDLSLSGAYEDLRQRLLPLGRLAISASRANHTSGRREAALNFRFLMEHHVLGPEDAQAPVWFRQRLA